MKTESLNLSSCSNRNMRGVVRFNLTILLFLCILMAINLSGEVIQKSDASFLKEINVIINQKEDTFNEGISAEILNVANFNLSFSQAIENIKNFPKKFTNEEFSLLDNLLNLDPQSCELSEMELATLKNDIIGRLCGDFNFNPILIDNLIKMFGEEKLGDTWREYCLQYLSVLYERAGVVNQQKILDFYCNLLNNAKEKQLGIGTVLLAFKNIFETKKNKELQKKIADLAMNVLKDKNLRKGSELPILHVLLIWNHPDLVVETQKILLQKNNSAILKNCLLRIILKYGSEVEKIEIKKKYGNSSNFLIRNVFKN